MLRQIAEKIVQAQRTVVFVGAGVSTESGIPDFRSPGGIWTRFDPEEFTYQNFLASERARERYWQLGREIYALIKAAQPNAAHLAIAEMERMGLLDCLITQNIDGLHFKAGNTPEKVIEIHGTVMYVLCLTCRKRYSRDEIELRLAAGEKVPRCDECGGLLKPATVAFGQPMPERETAEAFRRSAASDLFICIGSSLVVHPAAQLPVVAKDNGAFLVIINRDPTTCDSIADVVHRGLAGPAMEEIMRYVKEMKP
ncbi:MAG: NAD-dependent deacylase [Syntrophales bacterium]|nr:NAD-dependent deacylase [Syntrophales bacterium]